MKRIDELEKKVTVKCRKYENDCSSCPMNEACTMYARSKNEGEKMEALEKMVLA